MNRVGYILLSALVVLGAGCATAAKQRGQYVQKELDGYRYQQPLTDVWREVLVLLSNQGFQLGPNDAKLVGQREMGLAEALLSPAKDTAPIGEGSGLVQILAAKTGQSSTPTALQLDTDWRKQDQIRYHVEGFEEQGGTRIVFTKVTSQRDHQDIEERDVEMELALLRRVAPDVAAPIDDAADKIHR